MNDEIVKHINDTLIKLKIYINIKKIPENENPEKIVNVVERNLKFNNQQKVKRRSCMLASRPSDLAHVGCVAKVSGHSNLKLLSPKQMLQRLPIALAQIKADNY